ncbi:flagellar hook protein FlgE [Geminicoccaceae bacterium 1502E]|nr:flagellar hook protein FlgE [Geminicoccaceae bacterium 1502E]
MSLLGSLFTGVTGLNAQGRSMGVISDNIANVGTTGYKGAIAQFATLVTREDHSYRHAPGGVQSFTTQAVGQQGLIQPTASSTDLAISGSGFFVVNGRPDGSGEQLYTRAGAFAADAMGNLRLPSGHFLQGWRLGPDGAVADPETLATVNVRGLAGSATATSSIVLAANLDAGQAPAAAYAAGDLASFLASGGAAGVEPHYQRRVQLYDALGGIHDLTMAFVKTGPGDWRAEFVVDPASVDAPPHADGLVATADLVFDGLGQLANMTMTPAAAGPGGGAEIRWAAAIGAAPSELDLDLDGNGLSNGLTQYASPYEVAFLGQDGMSAGEFAHASVDEEGYVVAAFTNGVSRRLYRLPLATFPSPTGLEARSGTVWAQTTQSGGVVLREPGAGGAGQISPSALEGSTVDLAEEFTRMIVTQRAYSANARVISTADEMLEEVSRIRR